MSGGRFGGHAGAVGFYEDRVLPRVIDITLGERATGSYRSMATDGLRGDVVEVGFGSGLNIPHYPGDVTRVYAVDPSGGGRRLAAKRVAASPVPIEFVGLDGQRLPLDDESVDAVLTTWTLCTIPNVDAALGEMRRVLRPGGRFHFIEHGLHDDPKVQRRQHRFNPIQQKVAGGCNLDRPIDSLVSGAGFDLELIENHRMRGPKMLGYLYRGIGVKPAA